MSANIYWRVINPNPKSISTYAPSSFMSAMNRAGLRLPCTVGKESIQVLRGLAAAHDVDTPNPYQQIIDLLETHDKIELWAEY